MIQATINTGAAVILAAYALFALAVVRLYLKSKVQPGGDHAE